MGKIQCDVCGGPLILNAGGQSATCKNCGMEHSIARVREILAAAQQVPPAQQPPMGPQAQQQPNTPGAQPPPPQEAFHALHQVPPVQQPPMDPQTQQQPNTPGAQPPPPQEAFHAAQQVPPVQQPPMGPQAQQQPNTPGAQPPPPQEAFHAAQQVPPVQQSPMGPQAQRPPQPPRYPGLSREQVITIWQTWLPRCKPQFGVGMFPASLGAHACVRPQLSAKAANAASKHITKGQSAPGEIVGYYGDVGPGSVAIVATWDRVYLPDWKIAAVLSKCIPVRYADIAGATVKHAGSHKVRTELGAGKTNELYVHLKNGQTLVFKMNAFFFLPALAEALNALARCSIRPVEEKTRPVFRMTVCETFHIAGRGSMALGFVESGVVRVGDQVTIVKQSGQRRQAPVAAIQRDQKPVNHAAPGDAINLLLAGISQKELSVGDQLIGQ